MGECFPLFFGRYKCESTCLAYLSTLVQSKSTKGVAFVKYVGRAYNNYRNKDGTVSSFGNFKYLCSAHVHRPNEFELGPNRGFVDTIYITGEETE